ncbi:MAG: hypothetical protein RL654_1579 [Pseudomonadota bacterium]
MNGADGLDEAVTAGIVGEDAGEIDSFETRVLEVAQDAHGLRLDKWLAGVASEFSRSHLQGLIAQGLVRSAGRVLESASRKVAAGQRIEVELRPTAQSSAFRPEPIALSVLHEDDDILIVDKPAGMVVHPAAGNWSGTLLNALLARHPASAQLARAGIVHRLDKDTSGLMVVARTLRAQTELVRAIAAREVHREYVALVHALLPDVPPFSVEAPIGRDPVSRVKMAVVAGGKPARTDVTPLAAAVIEGRRYGAVRCRLHTGRTHQIRVHLASRGLPLVGDTVYGGRPELGLTRQALHAVQLGLVHPVSRAEMVFDSRLAPDLQSAWNLVVPR